MGIGRGMSRGLRDAERRPGVGRYASVLRWPMVVVECTEGQALAPKRHPGCSDHAALIGRMVAIPRKPKRNSASFANCS